MAITYPLTPPAAFKTASATWTPQSIVMSATSPFTGERQVQPRQGQWWEVAVNLPPLMRADADAVNAFITALNGVEGTFYYGPVLEALPKGVATGTPLVDGADQAGTDLDTDGWTANKTGILKAGDYIQIGTHIYKVLIDANSDADGKATLTLFPKLRSDATDGASIITNSPKGIFHLQNSVGWDASTDRTYTIQLQLKELL